MNLDRQENRLSNILRIGIPEGPLQEPSTALFTKIGLFSPVSRYSSDVISNDTEIEPIVLMPREIPVYAAEEMIDCGLSGMDWIFESGCEDSIHLLADLRRAGDPFHPVHWLLLVLNESPLHTLDDLRALPDGIRVCTKLKRLTEDWLARQGLFAKVDFSWGSTKSKLPILADAIVEAVRDWSPPKTSRLRALGSIFESPISFFASKRIYKTDPWKRQKLDDIALLLSGYLSARKKVKIEARVSAQEVAIVKALVPTDVEFSISDSHDSFSVIKLILDDERTCRLIPILARNGAYSISVSTIEMLF